MIFSTTKYQFLGFGGLTLANCIWVFYAIMFGSFLFSTFTLEYLKDIIPYWGIFVGIPLSVSLLIAYRMSTHKMLDRKDYAVSLVVGIIASLMFLLAVLFNSG